MIESIFNRIFKRKDNNANYNQFESYLYNKNLKHIGKGHIEEFSYPISFMNTYICLSLVDILNGDIFQIQTINNIEYILVAIQGQGVISAYDTKGVTKTRVGAAGYHYISDDRGLYLDDLIVCPEYRLNHIGSQILRTLVYAEYEYLKNHNIFVHAVATTFSENALNQSQLEHLYETNGYCLVDCEDEVYFKNDFKNSIENKNLKELVHEASTRSNTLQNSFQYTKN